MQLQGKKYFGEDKKNACISAVLHDEHYQVATIVTKVQFFELKRFLLNEEKKLSVSSGYSEKKS